MATEEQKSVAATQFVSIYDIYNAIQYPLSKIFIDIRTQQEYCSSHIIHAVHIPTNVSDDEIFQLFKDKFFFSSVYCLSNQQQIEKKEDVAFYTRLQSVFTNRLHEDEHSFYVLNTGVATFVDKFPFLCVSNDAMHWNVMVEGSKQKKHKKSKPVKVNMIDLYYQRLHEYPRYPNQILNDSLYLGEIQQASNGKILRDLQITHLLNMTALDYDDMSVIEQRSYHQIKIADTKNTAIADHFEAAFKFLDGAMIQKSDDEQKENEQSSESKQTPRILVHCKEGVSRSATIVIAFLMKTHKMTVSEALKYVQDRREVVDPNDGFRQQLQQFENNGYVVKDKHC